MNGHEITGKIWPDEQSMRESDSFRKFIKWIVIIALVSAPIVATIAVVAGNQEIFGNL